MVQKTTVLFCWVVCSLLSLHVLCASAELGVSVEFEVDHVVITGMEATAHCTINGYNPDIHTIQSFTWEHNNTVINLTSDRHTEIMLDRQDQRMLEIRPLMFEDAGSYTCRVVLTGSNSQDITMHSHSETLRIATELTVEAEPVQYAVLGQSSELLCTVQSRPSPNIQWCRVSENEGSETDLLRQHSSNSDNFGVYRIEHTRLEDAGLYRCKGFYSFGNGMTDIQLVVLNRPSINNSPFEDTVLLNEPISLDCSVGADSTTAAHNLTRVWTFTPANSEGARTISDSIDSRFTVDPSGTLRISQATYQDAGVYTCIVSNEAGTDSQDNTVVIEGPPVISLESGIITVRVSERADRLLLDCPAIGNPVPTTVWFNGLTQMIFGSSKFQLYDNGTLKINDFSASDGGNYRCEVRNVRGMDNRTYTVQVWEAPLIPNNFELTVDTSSNDRAVTLSWDAPSEVAESANLQGVEFYIVEQSINDGQYSQVGERILPPITSVTLTGLSPGERHTFRVVAGNVGGLSPPSAILSHTPAQRAPGLSSFEVTPLSDGRSVKVTWVLEFDGGSDFSEFNVEVSRGGDSVLRLPVDVLLGEWTITNLTPNTSYIFSVTAVNAIGRSTLQETQSTLAAVPSQPTYLTVKKLSTGSYSLSFKLREGSLPLTHFLVNYSQIDSREPPTQITISTNDSQHVDSKEKLDSSEIDSEYSVRLSVDGLERAVEYGFRVAGRSELGDGPFSDLIKTRNQNHLIYVIVASVLGSALLVTMVIVGAVLLAACRKRCSRGRKIAINGQGFHPSAKELESQSESNAFILKSPPAGRSRGGSFLCSPTTTPTSERSGVTSPFYRNNSYSIPSSITKLNTQNSISGSSDIFSRLNTQNSVSVSHIDSFNTQNSVNGVSGTSLNTVTRLNSVSGTNLDAIIDAQDNNSREKIVSEFASSIKSIPNSYSSGPTRQLLCLQTSFNSMGGDQNDGRSVVSENQLLTLSTNTNDDTLSKSTPMINRLSIDSVMDTVTTSYMTDV